MARNNWTLNPQNRIDPVKKILSRLSMKVRREQLDILLKHYLPGSSTLVLDVGVAPVEELVDTNYFEQHYPYPKRITAVSVEDCRVLFEQKYPKIKYLQVSPGSPLPFKNKQFDLVTSWATLEHVGNYQSQKYFLRELLRVGKNVFVTTPYRGCFYEPHTGFIFLHWLPLTWFRKICRSLGRTFWADIRHFNPLFAMDVKKMLPHSKIRIYSTFKMIPSHLIITA